MTMELDRAYCTAHGWGPVPCPTCANPPPTREQQASNVRAMFDAELARIRNGNGDEPNRPDLRERLLTLDALANLPPPRWLINQLLDLDSVVLMYGRRGAYKSFLAVDLLTAVATGARWHSRTVEQNAVLYVVAEGVGGLALRFDAWFTAHPHIPRPERLHILPEPVNLLSPGRVGELADVAAELECKLIVLDTLARCMVGGDENSAKDTGLAVEQLDNLRRRTGACVIAVHHSGKDTTAGARGSSALEAAADTVLEISATDALVTLTCTKQKNHAEPNPVRLHARGAASSVVLTDHQPELDELGASVIATLADLAAVAVPGGVSASIWSNMSGLKDGSSRSPRTFYRHRSALLTAGLVTNLGTDKMPRYQVSEAGAAALSSHCHTNSGSSSTTASHATPPIGGGSGSKTTAPHPFEDEDF